MNQRTSQAVDWGISCLPDKAQIPLTRFGLYALAVLGLRRIPVALLRGSTSRSGRTGTLLVAGDDAQGGYLPSRFFYEEPRRELIGNVPSWKLPRLLNRLRESADLTIVRVDRLSAHTYFGPDYLAIPEWVGTRLAVSDDFDSLVRVTRSIHEDMRLVRRHKLQPFVTEGAERLGEFYDAMYLPYTRARHGAMAHVKSRQELRCRLRRGGILWIIRDDRPLAGMLFERKGRALELHALGMVVGELPLNKRGIMAALYYFSVGHARDLGCEEVDFKGARPSLHDGLLRYKRKWGMTLYDRVDTYYDLLVRWNGANDVVKEFLSHTSLIFRDDERLSAIHTDESQSSESLWMKGLHRVYFLTERGLRPMMGAGTSLNVADLGSNSQRVYQGLQ